MKILIITEEESAHFYVRELTKKLHSLNMEIFLSSPINGCEDYCRIISKIPALKGFGIVEVLSNLTPHFQKMNEMINFIRENKIQSTLLVDYGGYNTILSQKISELTKVYYFIPPKVWIWGEFRAKILAETTHKIFTIFPFENRYFEKFGGNVEFVGHPLVNMMKKYSNVKKEKNLITLMPGSRKNEIDFSLIPIMESVDYLKKRFPRLRFELLLSSGIDDGLIESECAVRKIKIIRDENNKKMRLASSIFSISVSGTAVLESALLYTPSISLYSLNLLTMVVAKRVVNSSYVTLPNIVLEKKVIPEIVGESINSQLIIEESLKLINNESYRNWIEDEFKKLEEKLGGSHDVFEKISNSIFNDLKVA